MQAQGGEATESQGAVIPRLAALGALLAAAVLVAVLLLGAGESPTYRLLFQNAGQLVPGNQVRAGGHVVGSVEEVDLTDDFQAEVTISTGEPLHEGTTAVVRSTSLSGIANRYVSLAPGPEDAPELRDGSAMTGRLTTSAVDLDQLFDTFTPRTRQALRDTIQGLAGVYAGRGPEANDTYRYLAPALQSTTRLLGELGRDQRVLSQFLVEGGSAVSAIAERRDDLSSLVSNAGRALGAIAAENASLERSLAALPGALRQASTTFVNLRLALDDLDPLVATAKPATAELAPFLRELRPVAELGAPAFRDLGRTLDRPGHTNDLTDALRDLPGVQRRASAAISPILRALDDSQPVLDFARPYTPDLLGWLTKFGQVTAYYDANGHYARVQSANLDLFGVDTGEGELEPIPPSEQFQDLEFGLFARCPGGATQPIAGSNPFTDGGRLLAGGQEPNPKCDIDDVPPGP